MSKIAFLFSGQGAQVIGMGKEFAEQSEFCGKILEKADQATGGKITNICFNGSQEELNQTINTQPCLFTMEMMAYTAIVEKGIIPQGVAGFSLGEYGALAAAGCFDAQTGLAVVSKRAELMDAAAQANPGGMMAVLGLADDEVITACEAMEGVWPVNFNCDKQIVISARQDMLDTAEEVFAGLGGKVKRLAVSGGFHSPLMDDAAQQFAEYIEHVDVKHPQKEIFLNLDAEPHAGNVRRYMAEQINHPVLWKKTIENMIDKGYDTFVEIGPGKTLCGMMRRINKDVKTYNVENIESLNNTVGQMGVKPWGAQ